MSGYKEYIHGSPENFSHETYFDSLDYYNDELGMDIECLSEKNTVINFDEWIEYEILLSDSLSFDEYFYLKNKFKNIKLDDKSIDKSVLHKSLFHFRLLNDK